MHKKVINILEDTEKQNIERTCFYRMAIVIAKKNQALEQYIEKTAGYNACLEEKNYLNDKFMEGLEIVKETKKPYTIKTKLENISDKLEEFFQEQSVFNEQNSSIVKKLRETADQMNAKPVKNFYEKDTSNQANNPELF